MILFLYLFYCLIMDISNIQIINNENGFFQVELCGGHLDRARLLFCGEIVVDDSANEDLYCEESAEAFFNDFIENEEMNSIHWQLNVAKAIEEGYHYNKSLGFNNVVEAENYLIDKIQPSFQYCELRCSGYNQSYQYKDKIVSGQIFDFGHYEAEKEVYFRVDDDGNFTPVDWFEVPDGEERHQYVYVYDTIVYDGEVIRLFDSF